MFNLRQDGGMDLLKNAAYLMNPAGGLKYHINALVYRRWLWRTFIRELNMWLLQLKPRKTLLWVGPSAGYCVSYEFLNQFESIEIIEPDPIARKVLEKKLGRKNYRFVPILLDPDALDFFVSYLRDEHAESLILFSNLLGQLPLLFEKTILSKSTLYLKPEYEEKFRHFSEQLAGLHWASFHDRFSTASPLNPFPPFNSSFRKIDQLISQVTGGGGFRKFIVRDHHTHWIAPELSRHVLFWQRTHSQKHVIECVASPSALDRPLEF